MPKQVIPVEGIDQVGVIKDAPAVSLPPNAFSDARNVRFDDGAIRKMLGYEQVLQATSFTWTDIQYFAYWENPNRDAWIVVDRTSTQDEVWLIYFDPITNEITRDSRHTDTDRTGDWQHTVFNGGYSIVLNNRVSAPVHLTDSLHAEGVITSEDFMPLPGWESYQVPATDSQTNALETTVRVTADIVVSFGNLLMAGGLRERKVDGTIIRDLAGVVRSSSVATLGDIPQNWNPFTTGAGTADELLLADTGRITAMRELQGKMMIYTTDSIHQVEVGLQGLRTIPITTEYGALSHDAVYEFDGRHLIVGSNDIYMFSGHPGSIQSISDGRVRRYFYDNLSPVAGDNLFVLRNNEYDEIWICFPNLASRFGYCNEALVYNFRNNNWTIADLPDHILSGVIAGDTGPLPGGGSPNASITFAGGPSGNNTAMNTGRQEVQTLTIDGRVRAGHTGLGQVQELAMPTMAYNLPHSGAVSNITNNATALITASTTGLAVNQVIRIGGASNTNFNGEYTITGLTAPNTILTSRNTNAAGSWAGNATLYTEGFAAAGNEIIDVTISPESATVGSGPNVVNQVVTLTVPSITFTRSDALNGGMLLTFTDNVGTWRFPASAIWDTNISRNENDVASGIAAYINTGEPGGFEWTATSSGAVITLTSSVPGNRNADGNNLGYVATLSTYTGTVETVTTSPRVALTSAVNNTTFNTPYRSTGVANNQNTGVDSVTWNVTTDTIVGGGGLGAIATRAGPTRFLFTYTVTAEDSIIQVGFDTADGMGTSGGNTSGTINGVTFTGFSSEQNGAAVIVARYRGPAYQGGDGGAIFNTSPQLSVGDTLAIMCNVDMGAFLQSARRANLTVYDYAARNNRTFPVTINGVSIPTGGALTQFANNQATSNQQYTISGTTLRRTWTLTNNRTDALDPLQVNLFNAGVIVDGTTTNFPDANLAAGESTSVIVTSGTATGTWTAQVNGTIPQTLTGQTITNTANRVGGSTIDVVRGPAETVGASTNTGNGSDATVAGIDVTQAAGTPIPGALSTITWSGGGAGGVGFSEVTGTPNNTVRLTITANTVMAQVQYNTGTVFVRGPAWTTGDTGFGQTAAALAAATQVAAGANVVIGSLPSGGASLVPAGTGRVERGADTPTFDTTFTNNNPYDVILSGGSTGGAGTLTASGGTRTSNETVNTWTVASPFINATGTGAGYAGGFGVTAATVTPGVSALEGTGGTSEIPVSSLASYTWVRPGTTNNIAENDTQEQGGAQLSITGNNSNNLFGMVGGWPRTGAGGATGDSPNYTYTVQRAGNLYIRIASSGGGADSHGYSGTSGAFVGGTFTAQVGDVITGSVGGAPNRDNSNDGQGGETGSNGRPSTLRITRGGVTVLDINCPRGQSGGISKNPTAPTPTVTGALASQVTYSEGPRGPSSGTAILANPGRSWWARNGGRATTDNPNASGAGNSLAGWENWDYTLFKGQWGQGGFCSGDSPSLSWGWASPGAVFLWQDNQATDITFTNNNNNNTAIVAGSTGGARTFTAGQAVLVQNDGASNAWSILFGGTTVYDWTAINGNAAASSITHGGVTTDLNSLTQTTFASNVASPLTGVDLAWTAVNATDTTLTAPTAARTTQGVGVYGISETESPSIRPVVTHGMTGDSDYFTHLLPAFDRNDRDATNLARHLYNSVIMHEEFQGLNPDLAGVTQPANAIYYVTFDDTTGTVQFERITTGDISGIPLAISFSTTDANGVTRGEEIFGGNVTDSVTVSVEGQSGQTPPVLRFTDADAGTVDVVVGHNQTPATLAATVADALESTANWRNGTSTGRTASIEREAIGVNNNLISMSIQEDTDSLLPDTYNDTFAQTRAGIEATPSVANVIVFIPAGQHDDAGSLEIIPLTGDTDSVLTEAQIATLVATGINGTADWNATSSGAVVTITSVANRNYNRDDNGLGTGPVRTNLTRWRTAYDAAALEGGANYYVDDPVTNVTAVETTAGVPVRYSQPTWIRVSYNDGTTQDFLYGGGYTGAIANNLQYHGDIYRAPTVPAASTTRRDIDYINLDMRDEITEYADRRLNIISDTTNNTMLVLPTQFGANAFYFTDWQVLNPGTLPPATLAATVDPEAAANISTLTAQVPATGLETEYDPFRPWPKFVVNKSKRFMTVVGPQHIYGLDLTYGSNGVNRTSYIERKRLHLQPTKDVEMLSGIYLDAEGDNSTFDIYVEAANNATVDPLLSSTSLSSNLATYTYNLGGDDADYKADIRVTGRMISYRVENTSTVRWDIGGLGLEVGKGGTR